MKEVPRICLVVVFAFHLGLKIGFGLFEKCVQLLRVSTALVGDRSLVPGYEQLHSSVLVCTCVHAHTHTNTHNQRLYK